MSERPPPQRDARIDVLRGFALLTIFVDHAPGNFLGMLTLRNFGFSDAAELFVILAGYSAMLAYGKCFARDGVGTGLRRVAARGLRLYVFQAGLLLATLAIMRNWLARFGDQLPDLAPFLGNGMKGMRHGLELSALPSNLDILPLYIVLVAFFPLVYAGLRLNRGATLAVSAVLWLAANLDPHLNLTNWLDGRGWFFDPYAWQFLFVIGAYGATLTATHGGSLPRRQPLVWASWAYLAFVLLATAPWVGWGLSSWQPIDMAPPDKTGLSILRLLDILAMVYLALSSKRFALIAQWSGLSGLDACGRHSLEIFSLGTLLALMGRLLFKTFGTPFALQAAVDVVGFGAMLALAFLLEARSLRTRAAKIPAVAAAPRPQT